MPNPNANCLKGKRCPKCKSYGPFEVVGTCPFTVRDTGIDTEGRTPDFDRNSYAYCSCCDFSGAWDEFDDPEMKEKADAGPEA